MPSPTRSATPQPQLAEDRRPALWSTPADDERARLARKSYAQKIAITVAQSVKIDTSVPNSKLSSITA